MWDITESTATMMAACIPSLRVLFRDMRKTSAQVYTSDLPYISVESPRVQSKKNPQIVLNEISICE
jgi:hypothetical protein